MSEVPAVSSFNTLDLVQRVVEDLASAGFDTRVFGGWAEELQGLEAPRQHRDIDLLVIDPDEVQLDRYLHLRDEIGVKHLPHKRALTVGGVMVELLLVRSGPDGPVTRFWGEYEFRWPGMDATLIAGLPVVAPEVLVTYRAGYPDLPRGHWDYDYHPHEDFVRVFIHRPSGVLRDDSGVLVTEAESGDGIFLRHYAFADEWFKINVALDHQGRLAEYGDDGFSFNCDLATPMVRKEETSWAVDLFLDVLVRADGRGAHVADDDEMEDAVERGWVSRREAEAARRSAETLVELARTDRLVDFLDRHVPLGLPRAGPALQMARAGVDSGLLPGQRPSW